MRWKLCHSLFVHVQISTLNCSCHCFSSCSLTRHSNPFAPSRSCHRDVQTLFPASLSCSQPIAVHTDGPLTSSCAMSKTWHGITFLPCSLSQYKNSESTLCSVCVVIFYPASSPCGCFCSCNSSLRMINAAMCSNCGAPSNRRWLRFYTIFNCLGTRDSSLQLRLCARIIWRSAT